MAGERINFLRENKKALMVGIFAWIGVVFASIIIRLLKIQNIPVEYSIQFVFLILFGILGSKIQTSSSVRDG